MDLIDTTGFKKFLVENNIIVTVIATIVSSCVTELSESLVNDLILPILNRDSDGDGEADLKNLEEYVIFTNGIKFKLGKFILVIIKFIIILFIVYQFSKLAKKNNL
tara:strand:- start:147 stop:464 length:318 start_codon:yes stop_codon:yes gene_type:complete